jgi:hypothetical protein
MNEKEAARLFASMGGKARAKKLPKERRVEIARAGGHARWKKINAPRDQRQTE